MISEKPVSMKDDLMMFKFQGGKDMMKASCKHDWD
jgi:hypothetical protein